MIKLSRIIDLKPITEAESFTATSKDTGKVSVFKSKDARDAAVKAGTHEKRKDDKDGDDKKDTPKVNIFKKDKAAKGGDSSAGKSEPKKDEPSKYDSEYFADDEKEDDNYLVHPDTDDYDDVDDEGTEGVRKTEERLDKIEKALEDDLKLDDNGFRTSRSSSGGMGSWEGPLEIYDENAVDADGVGKDGAVTLSIGSGENDGNFSIGFPDFDGMEVFDGGYSINGNEDLSAEESFKLGKTLMKMPEVQKFLKGKISKDKFKPIFDKIKSKFSGKKPKSDSSEKAPRDDKNRIIVPDDVWEKGDKYNDDWYQKKFAWITSKEEQEFINTLIKKSSPQVVDKLSKDSEKIKAVVQRQIEKKKSAKKESSIKLKSMLPEGLLREGTRSQVGIIDRSGKIASAYVHFDGYPSNMKKGLKKHMKNEKDVLTLIKKGGARGIFDDKPIEYFNEKPSPLKGNMKILSRYIKSAGSRGGAEYVYLYNMKDKKWYFADTYDDNELKKLF